MRQDEVDNLVIGDRIGFPMTADTLSTQIATVQDATENYVALNWALRKPNAERRDVLLRLSPVWRHLELVL